MILIDQQYTTGYDFAPGFRYDNTSIAWAQGFTPSKTGYIPYVEFYLGKQGTPTGNVWLTIETNNAGKPSGTVLATSSNNSIASLGALGFIKFTFPTPAYVTAGTLYHIAAYGDCAVNTTNCMLVGGDNSSAAYTGGTGSTKSTTSWTAGTYDLLFKEHVDSGEGGMAILI